MYEKLCKIVLGAVAFAVGFAATAVIAGQAFVPVAASSAAEINNNSVKMEEPPLTIAPEYPVNKSGKTYGGIANVLPEDYPDLIGVIATNGKEGYAHKEDFCDEYIPKSPEDAVRYMEKLKELNDQGYYFQAIPVYDIDGETVIGEFEINFDVSLCSSGYENQEEMKQSAIEREKLYEESRKQGKVLRESIKTIMEEVQ